MKRETFSDEETERRTQEMFNRIFHRKATMNMRTGQNLGEPFLSDDELHRRGYPAPRSPFE